MIDPTRKEALQVLAELSDHLLDQVRAERETPPRLTR